MNGNPRGQNRIYLYLAVMDLLWSVCAWVFDWPKLHAIPAYLLPFILTCPVYPLLLSISWFQIYTYKKLNLFVLYLGIIGSVVYGFGAIFYYPVNMSLNGFDWYAFGGIFWVLFYAIQGIYLLFRWNAKFNLLSLILAGVFMGSKIIIDYSTRTYGYIVDNNFPQMYFKIIIELMALVFALVVARYIRLRGEC